MLGLELAITKRTDPILLECMSKHYSKPRGFVGRNICYKILFNNVCYGVIVGGSATRYLPGRDEFLGLDDTTITLNNIINNVFYHIEPKPRYPTRNFTSKILVAWRNKIREDWVRFYGDKVVGFEALVELPRKGDLYKKDGWVEVGVTKGFTCKRESGYGTDSWTGARIWNTIELRPKRVFCRLNKEERKGEYKEMIIDDNVTTQDTSTGIKQLRTIDINDSSLPEGKEETINPLADAWERACPPPDGVFHLKLHEAKIPYQAGETDNGDLYYVANLECKIVDAETTPPYNNPSYNGTTIFGKVSSYIPVGKEISTMAGLISKMTNGKVPPKTTHLALLQLLKRCLAQEPVLYCEGEWKAWDMPKGEWIKQGMKQFPRTEDGKGYRHIVRDSKGGEVVAKWKPVRWFGNREYKEMMERDKLRKQQQSSNMQASQSKATSATGGRVNGGEVVMEEIVPANIPKLSKTTAAPANNMEVDDIDFLVE